MLTCLVNRHPTGSHLLLIRDRAPETGHILQGLAGDQTETTALGGPVAAGRLTSDRSTEVDTVGVSIAQLAVIRGVHVYHPTPGGPGTLKEMRAKNI